MISEQIQLFKQLWNRLKALKNFEIANIYPLSIEIVPSIRLNNIIDSNDNSFWKKKKIFFKVYILIY